MDGLRVLASVVLSFLFPGLGQLYQATYYPERANMALYLIGGTIGLIYTVLFIWLVPVVWIIGVVEALMWAMNKNTVKAAIVMISLLFISSSAYARSDESKLIAEGGFESLPESAPPDYDKTAQVATTPVKHLGATERNSNPVCLPGQTCANGAASGAPSCASAVRNSTCANTGCTAACANGYCNGSCDSCGTRGVIRERYFFRYGPRVVRERMWYGGGCRGCR